MRAFFTTNSLCIIACCVFLNLLMIQSIFAQECGFEAQHNTLSTRNDCIVITSVPTTDGFETGFEIWNIPRSSRILN